MIETNDKTPMQEIKVKEIAWKANYCYCGKVYIGRCEGSRNAWYCYSTLTKNTNHEPYLDKAKAWVEQQFAQFIKDISA
jgi:hypothetical protein